MNNHGAGKAKKTRSSIKHGLLISVVILVSAFISCTVLFKHMILKGIVKNSVESIAGAVCDIDSAKIWFLQPRVEIHNFAVADKNSPMHNIVSFDSAVFAFNLTELLKSKFIVDEASVVNMQFGTPRTVSGALPPKKLKKIEKKKQKNPLIVAVETQSKALISSVAQRGQVGVMRVFDQYNPEKIVAQYLNQLKTPIITDQAQKTTAALSSSWLQQADDLTESSNLVFNSAARLKIKFEDVLNSATIDGAKIASAIKEINTVASQIQTTINQVNTASKKIQADAKTVNGFSAAVQNAVLHDMTMMQREIAKIASFSVHDGQRLITGTFDTVAYTVIGKYYPQIRKVAETIFSTQKNSSKEKKSAAKRRVGRTVNFDKTLPSVLIRSIKISAAENTAALYASGEARNITNNADLLNKPTEIDLTFSQDALYGTIKTVIDLRSTAKNAPVHIAVAATGIPVSFSVPHTETIAGISAVNGNAKITAQAAILQNGFDLTSTFALQSVQVSVAQFEPQFVYSVYSSSLAAIKDFSVNLDSAYSDENGFTVSIFSDVDTQFAASVTQQMNKKINAFRTDVAQQVKQQLSAYTAQFQTEIFQFTETKKRIEAEKERLEKIAADLNAQKMQAENKIKNQAAEAVKQHADNAIQNAIKKLF